MNDHDVMQVTDAPGGVALTCVCGKRSVRPTKAQAEQAHIQHWGVIQARSALHGGR